MSYPPLYPEIDPQEVAQAHQFNVTHQPPQSQHNFVHQTSPYPPTTNAYPTDQTYPPTSTQFLSGHFYAPSHSNQVPQYYYYQPQQMTVQSNAQTLQYHPQPTPVQTSFPHLYPTQTSQPTSVQTTVAPQTQPPVSHNITTHTSPHVHHQEHFKPIEEAHPPQQLSDEEEEDEETTSSIITTDRKLARLLSRVERTLKRLQISIMKRNRTGTARSKELLENHITELQAFHIADAEERAQVNILIERIHLSIKHAGEELELMEQDRQRNLTQYRNAVLELKKEAQQAQQLLESDLDQQTQDIINQVHQQQRQT